MEVISNATNFYSFRNVHLKMLNICTSQAQPASVQSHFYRIFILLGLVLLPVIWEFPIWLPQLYYSPSFQFCLMVRLVIYFLALRSASERNRRINLDIWRVIPLCRCRNLPRYRRVPKTLSRFYKRLSKTTFNINSTYLSARKPCLSRLFLIVLSCVCWKYHAPRDCEMSYDWGSGVVGDTNFELPATNSFDQSK